jgi:hypothetical protein
LGSEMLHMLRVVSFSVLNVSFDLTCFMHACDANDLM